MIASPENDQSAIPLGPQTREQYEVSEWLVYGLNALDCLHQKHDHERVAEITSNRFLALVHEVPIHSPGIVKYRKDEAEAKRRAAASSYQAKYNVAIALGIQATDPSLSDSNNSLNIENPRHRAYVDMAFHRFINTYDNPTLDGHIKNIREGREMLQLWPRIDEKYDVNLHQGHENHKPEIPGIPVSSEMSEILRKLINQAMAVQPPGQEMSLIGDEKVTQRAIRRGSTYLLAAQVASRILNKRETYDPRVHGRTAPLSPIELEVSLSSPEAKLREDLRSHRTNEITQFLKLALVYGSAFSPVLKDAHILPQDYPEPNPAEVESIVKTYQEQLASPSSKIRDKHFRTLRKVVFPPEPKPRKRSGHRSRRRDQKSQLFGPDAIA